MATENLTTGASRRAILKFATTAVAYTSGAAIVGTGMALATQAKAETPSISAGLAEAITACTAADRACEEYELTVFEPLHDRWTKASEVVPHVAVPIDFLTFNRAEEWTTADRVAVSIARAHVNGKRAFTDNGDDASQRYDQSLIDLAAAADGRDAEIARLRGSIGLDEARERSDELGTASSEAADDVYSYRVTTLADLEAKIAFMVHREAFEIDGTGESILADVRRILAAREA